MGTVFKYNLYKGISTFCTIGSPIITLACCSDFFVHNSGTSLSAAGMFAIFIALLFCKDKLAENFKMPSAFIVSAVCFGLILIVEKLLAPIKIVCLVTMITAGIDELTFKQWYKAIKSFMPEVVSNYEHFGFIFTTTDKLGG